MAHSVCVGFRVQPMESGIDLFEKLVLISLAEVVHCLHVVECARYRYGGIDCDYKGAEVQKCRKYYPLQPQSVHVHSYTDRIRFLK